MGVSGEAHTQPTQPLSQVIVSGSGSWHLGPMSTGPGTLQQISPALQHTAPQHVAAGPQSWGEVQGGAPHLPRSQYGWGPSHFVAQPPQCRMSLSGFTQTSPQHSNGAMQVAALHAPPELDDEEEEELLDEEPLDEELLDVDPLDDELEEVFVAPPCPPAPSTPPPQPASPATPIAKRYLDFMAPGYRSRRASGSLIPPPRRPRLRAVARRDRRPPAGTNAIDGRRIGYRLIGPRAR